MTPSKMKPYPILIALSAIMAMSTSGVLGRAMSLPVLVQSWGRSLIAAITLFIILKSLKKRIKLPKGFFRVKMLVVSILMGLHWVFYFYALVFSNVALGMLSLFTYTLFTTLLEPIVLGTSFKIRHLLFAMTGFLGLYLLIPSFSFENQQTLGLAFGLISAIAYTFRNLSMKRWIDSVDGTVMMYFQMVLLSVLLAFSVFLYPTKELWVSFQEDWYLLLMLGVITSALGHTLFVVSFKFYSTTTMSIMSNMTPVFGIILAYFILHEIPDHKVVVGGSLILISSFLEGYISSRSS